MKLVVDWLPWVLLAAALAAGLRLRRRHEATVAALDRDPDVEVLRQRIGLDIHQRLAAALGPGTDPDVIESLEMLYSGALVRAGMGYASYEDIARRLAKTARLMLR